MTGTGGHRPVRHHVRPIVVTVALLGATAAMLSACGTGSGDRGEIIVSASDPQYASLQAMASDADLVVKGEVRAIVEDSVIPGPVATQVVTVVVTVNQILSADDGTTPTEVSFPWMAWDLNADGTPGPVYVTNGLRLPQVGEEYVLFLRQAEPWDQEGPNPPSHTLISFDGFLRVGADGTVSSTLDSAARLGRELSGMRVTDLAAQVAQATG